jgi:hypothetical protein
VLSLGPLTVGRGVDAVRPSFGATRGARQCQEEREA